MIDYCEEYGEIIAIVPVPAGQCTHSVPFNVRNSHVGPRDTELSLDMGEAAAAAYVYAGILFGSSGFFVEGWDSRAHARTVITIRPHPSIKSTPKMSAEGISYTVKVSATTEENVDAVNKFVNELTSYPYFDLFLVSSTMQCYVIRGIEPATSVQFDQQLPLYKGGTVNFELHCVNGIQYIQPFSED